MRVIGGMRDQQWPTGRGLRQRGNGLGVNRPIMHDPAARHIIDHVAESYGAGYPPGDFSQRLPANLVIAKAELSYVRAVGAEIPAAER